MASVVRLAAGLPQSVPVVLPLVLLVFPLVAPLVEPAAFVVGRCSGRLVQIVVWWVWTQRMWLAH
ncbi:MAG: hypothetical protein CYG59_13570 [Chloroflexi bacterium]|nr:MAG: hypothetical protein CYG59_13570 [Chloroflexota bacterium]